MLGRVDLASYDAKVSKMSMSSLSLLPLAAPPSLSLSPFSLPLRSGTPKSPGPGPCGGEAGPMKQRYQLGAQPQHLQGDNFPTARSDADPSQPHAGIPFPAMGTPEPVPNLQEDRARYRVLQAASAMELMSRGSTPGSVFRGESPAPAAAVAAPPTNHMLSPDISGALSWSSDAGLDGVEFEEFGHAVENWSKGPSTKP